MISFISALEKCLVSLGQPVVSDYSIFLCAQKISDEGSYKDMPIHAQKTPFSREKGLRLLRELKSRHIIRKDEDFKSTIYRVNEIADRDAEEICAIADPFCYISHLSAMSRQGLTNRIPGRLYITTPERVLWNRLRDAVIEKDYGLNLSIKNKQTFKQPGFYPQIRNISVIRHESKSPARVQNIKGSYARISEIGDTFVDMLSHPALCGGMEHIMDIWKEHAPTYLDEIVEAVDRCSAKIIKVRAGYMLDELLQIEDQRIQSWVTFAQRGGSRVLNSENSYVPIFSKKWMISLNA